jgi:hypothetical protein
MDIRVKAGKKAFASIRENGFDFNRVKIYVGPAVGPRWLMAGGFDLTLMEKGLLGNKYPALLTGASAGAFRLAAWLQPEPAKSYRRLMDAYINADYSHNDGPQKLLGEMEKIIDAYLETDALPFALNHKRYRLAIVTARARNLAASETSWLQKIGVGLAFAGNAMSPSLLRLFYEQVVFYYSPIPPKFCLSGEFRGKCVPLNTANFKSAVLASGAIPLVVGGVRNIYGAPMGIYRDGGLFQYHFNQLYPAADGDLILFFHHQESLVPGWLDKMLKYHRVPEPYLENAVMVFPTEEFVSRLPGGKVPDRDDLTELADKPDVRKKRWRRAAELSADLGEQFVELAASGRIREAVEEF